jgi:hypothetical protein
MDPVTIDLSDPQPCQFCTHLDNKTKALFLPWRRSEGWWSCMECKDAAMKRMSTVMSDRRIVGISALPAFLREWGLFNIKRSDNQIAEMVLIDFECEFSHNTENANNTEGRVRLSNDEEPDIYIDMCTSDNRCFKQVKLQNILENNPELLEQNADLKLTLPSYVSSTLQNDWHAAAKRAVDQNKKKNNVERSGSPCPTETSTVTVDEENITLQMAGDEYVPIIPEEEEPLRFW